MRSLYFPAILASALAISGCATLFTGSSDTISFSSEPPGASVLIDGLTVGTTPVTVPVRRSGLGDRQVTIQLEGYQPRTFTLSKKFNAVSILNLGNVLGWGIDVATGAVMSYDRKNYTVNMQTGSVSMNLDELRQEDGSFVVPDLAQQVVVVDEANGLGIVFN